MARIPYPDERDLSDHVRELLNELAPLNVFRMMAHGDNLLRQFVRLGNQLLFESELDPELRELVILRVGYLCGSGYEVHQHRRIARDLGVESDRLEALREGAEAGVFNGWERRVLRFTDAVVHGKPDEALFESVREGLSDRELVELVVCIGYYVMVSRFLETFEVEIENAEAHLEVEGDDG